MRLSSRWAVLGVLGLSLLAGGDEATQPANPTAAKETKDSNREGALKALREMGQVLGTAKNMQFKVESLLPMKAATGQWLIMIGSSEVARDGTDHLRVKVGGDSFPLDVFYDGKQIVAFSPEKNVFAEKEAPASIDALLRQVRERGVFSVPYGDVLVADPYAAMTSGMKDATFIGSTKLEGTETYHLAFRGKEVDWQIWIGKDDHLPHLAVLTDRSDATKPSSTLRFTDWKVNTSLPAGTFSFRNQTNASQVEFRAPGAQKAAARQAPPTPRP
jgi:hypothetical protein